MGKQAYITLLGRSAWALINTYYAGLRNNDISPEKIYIFFEDSYKDKMNNIIAGLEVLNSAFEVNTSIESISVESSEFKIAGIKIRELIRKLKDDGYLIYLDITPGRKALVAAAVLCAKEYDIGHVFYLAVDEQGKQPLPYTRIPFGNQMLRDFVDELAWRG